MSAPILHILLVEDSPSDVDLTIEAMREAKVANVMDVVADGVDAMAFLRKEGRYEGARPRPPFARPQSAPQGRQGGDRRDAG